MCISPSPDVLCFPAKQRGARPSVVSSHQTRRNSIMLVVAPPVSCVTRFALFPHDMSSRRLPANNTKTRVPQLAGFDVRTTTKFHQGEHVNEEIEAVHASLTSASDVALDMVGAAVAASSSAAAAAARSRWEGGNSSTSVVQGC